MIKYTQLGHGVINGVLEPVHQRAVGIYLSLMIAEFERARAGILAMGTVEGYSYSAGSLRYYDDAIGAFRRALQGVTWKRPYERWHEAIDMHAEGKMTIGRAAIPPKPEAIGGLANGDG